MIRAARYVAAIWIGFHWAALIVNGYQGDAYAYWSADLGHLYDGAAPATFGAFLYSPLAAIVLQPLTLLPWPAFYALWTGAQLGVTVALVGPIPAALLVWHGSPLWHAIASGNIAVLYAGAIVAAFRWPALWAFPLLTKVTPGVGLLWYAARKEWRPVLIAGGATLALAAVSFAVTPGLWFEWFDVLRRNAGYTMPGALLPLPLIPRLVAAALVAIVGGWKGWRWAVPLAAFLGLPYVADTMWPVLLAIWPLGVRERLAVALCADRKAGVVGVRPEGPEDLEPGGGAGGSLEIHRIGR